MNKLKIVVLIFISLMLFACSDPIESLIPPSSVHGAITQFNVSGDLKENGKKIDAYVTVPHDIKRDQVRPTLLAAIKGLKKENKKIDWIAVDLLAGGDSSFFAGRGELKSNQIKIEYWVPTEAQIHERIEYNQNQRGEDSAILPIPELMSKEAFAMALKANDLYHKYYNKLSDRDNQLISENEDLFDELNNTRTERARKLTAKKLGLSSQDVLDYRSRLNNYYTIGWGKETISL